MDDDELAGIQKLSDKGLVSKSRLAQLQREKARLWRDIQRQIAEDAVNVFLWNGAQVAVFRKGLRGLWTSSPIVANDLAALSWAPQPVKL